MNTEINTEGITPTPEFIQGQNTGQFIKILPDTYMIKGAINDRGFDQAYALQKGNKKEYILIDVVERATKEAVEKILHEGGEIKAILISGDNVMKDAYADLATISEDAGGAEIYIHPESSIDDEFETRALTTNDALLSDFHIEVQDLSSDKGNAVLIYCSRNDGMLFTGDSAIGSAYGTDDFTFTRDKMENEREEFKVSESWNSYDTRFRYLFPRQGKPAIDVDEATRISIVNKLRKGV